MALTKENVCLNCAREGVVGVVEQSTRRKWVQLANRNLTELITAILPLRGLARATESVYANHFAEMRRYEEELRPAYVAGIVGSQQARQMPK
jgi:hypothetical protein